MLQLLLVGTLTFPLAWYFKWDAYQMMVLTCMLAIYLEH